MVKKKNRIIIVDFSECPHFPDELPIDEGPSKLDHYGLGVDERRIWRGPEEDYEDY